jgi:DNA (cytosine-5)-methyltransferase 1
MKILNLYAGIGGNRKLWGDEHEITAVELDPAIATVYQQFFPNDTVIVADAHQYLLDHFKEFDFIWSSPPCPTQSKNLLALKGWGIYRYPDMQLYQEIIFLQTFYSGKFVVENVKPYYKPLIEPSFEIDRHFFWSNFEVDNLVINRIYKGRITDQRKEVLATQYDIQLPLGTKNQRKLLRNAVNPQIGLHILKEISNDK